MRQHLRGFLRLYRNTVHFHPGSWSFDLQITIAAQHLQLSSAASIVIVLISMMEDPLPIIAGYTLWFIVLTLIEVLVQIQHLIQVYFSDPTHSFLSGHVENDVVYFGFLL